MRIQVQYAGDGFMGKVYSGYKAKKVLRDILRDTEFTMDDIRSLRHGQALVKPGQVAEALFYRGRMWISVYDDTEMGRWDRFTVYLG